jgi:hypothetical protein
MADEPKPAEEGVEEVPAEEAAPVEEAPPAPVKPKSPAVSKYHVYEKPPGPPKVQQVLPTVFSRFNGGELPGFLLSWQDDGPKKVDIEEIAEESELSKDQIKSKFYSLNLNS